MEFQDKVVVVTGGASGIGKHIAESFLEQGAKVCIIDIQDNPYFVGDMAKKEELEAFAAKVLAEHGGVDILVNNAMVALGGLRSCGYSAFEHVMRVGAIAPYYLTKLFMGKFREGAAIVNITSTRASMSQPNTESYTAAKGALSAMTHAMAVSLAQRVRVNSVSPGWIDTQDDEHGEADNRQHLTGRVGRMADVRDAVFFLCSDKASFITGQDICVDGGMSKQMVYHGDYGWNFEEQ